MHEQVGPRQPRERPRGVANLREQVDMANATTPRRTGVKMTLRVYTVDRYGMVTEDRGTLDILHGREPLPLMSVDPPRACPRHRAEQQAVIR